jgi:hypothetical protein
MKMSEIYRKRSISNKQQNKELKDSNYNSKEEDSKIFRHKDKDSSRIK